MVDRMEGTPALPNANAVRPPARARVDIQELRAQVELRVGQERAKRYFSCLNAYLGQRVSKCEFDKQCALALGCENLQLHNRLVRAIAYNASNALGPPPFRKRATYADGKMLSSTVQCNGTALPNGMSGVGGNHAAVLSEDRFRVNGIHSMPDFKHPKRVRELQQNESQLKRPREETPLLHEQRSSQSKAKTDPSSSLSYSVCAPLGIPFCPASVGRSQNTVLPLHSSSNSRSSSCYEYAELCNTEVLQSRMENIAQALSLDGVTMDCADLLNIGLDVYLKRLIKSCIERRGGNACKDVAPKVAHLQAHQKHIDDILPENQLYSERESQLSKDCCSISLQDLRVAVEINPRQLGEDWPLLCEKICLFPLDENR